jgi:hypothetical protein
MTEWPLHSPGSEAGRRKMRRVEPQSGSNRLRLVIRQSITAVSRIGERNGLDWLTYNPFIMRRYERFTRADAPAVVRALASTFPNAHSLVDIGAGTGALAAEAGRQGLAVMACERSLAGRLRAMQHGVRCHSFDLARTPPARLRGALDLSLCLEVAEHVPPDFADKLVSFVAASAPLVVFTAAHPGQGGHGHINEQPPGYWISRFRSYGQHYSLRLTSALSESFANEGVQAPWLYDNLMVFAEIPLCQSAPPC